MMASRRLVQHRLPSSADKWGVRCLGAISCCERSLPLVDGERRRWEPPRLTCSVLGTRPCFPFTLRASALRLELLMLICE